MQGDSTQVNILNTRAIEMNFVIAGEALDLLRQTPLCSMALVHERR
jgi:hypothetical protein